VTSLVVKEWWAESRDVAMTTELGSCVTSRLMTAGVDVGVATAVTKVNKHVTMTHERTPIVLVAIVTEVTQSRQ